MKKVIILGAAGRDFHNFNVYFRDNPKYKVVAFTAAQIPNISNRKYPPSLAGPLYPQGIPILPEEKLEEIIEKENVDFVVFSYSDVSSEHVMELAARALGKGASYLLLGPKHTMLKSKKPVIAICAVRTGCGKSPLTRKIAKILKERGKRVVIVRHPMPYGNLEKQRVQRFASLEDIKKAECTFEEIEEYEHLVSAGFVVYAGVDYKEILSKAEKEADVIIWDGGNNDFPFFQPDLLFVLTDALRPGHELTYWPGSAVIRMANVVVINKVDQNPAGAKKVEINVKKVNPNAKIIHAILSVEGPALKGQRVVCVEDGPTITHGGMPYGAAYVFAKKHDLQIIDPRPYAIGSIKEAYNRYPHIQKVLPALGYGKEQKAELEKVLNTVPADLILLGTPIDLCRYLNVNKPCIRVKYELKTLDMELKTLFDKFQILDS